MWLERGDEERDDGGHEPAGDASPSRVVMAAPDSNSRLAQKSMLRAACRGRAIGRHAAEFPAARRVAIAHYAHPCRRLGLGSYQHRTVVDVGSAPGRGSEHGTHRRERRPAQVLLLRQEPEAGAAADRRPRRLHLRRVRRAVQRDHRRAPGRGRRRGLERVRPAQAARRSSPSSRSTSSARTPPRAPSRSPSTTTTSASAPATRIDVGRRRHRRHRDRQVQHPADRPDRLRQDLPRADPREAAQRAVRGRGCHGAHRGRLRRRRRREHPPQAHPGRRLRRQARRDRHHLHRRGRQDRPQGREPVDHPRRLGRGRAAGAAEDPRGHGRLGSAAGRPQAPAPGVHPDRHDERAVHRGRRLRRARRDHLASARARRASASAPRCTARATT